MADEAVRHFEALASYKSTPKANTCDKWKKEAGLGPNVSLFKFIHRKILTMIAGATITAHHPTVFTIGLLEDSMEDMLFAPSICIGEDVGPLSTQTEESGRTETASR
jgi:hypothetical protein